MARNLWNLHALFIRRKHGKTTIDNISSPIAACVSPGISGINLSNSYSSDTNDPLKSLKRAKSSSSYFCPGERDRSNSLGSERSCRDQKNGENRNGDKKRAKREHRFSDIVVPVLLATGVAGILESKKQQTELDEVQFKLWQRNSADDEVCKSLNSNLYKLFLCVLN